MEIRDIVLLVSFVPVLAVIGDVLRYSLFRRSALFQKLGFLQVLLLDFFLGGVILYLLALVPFPVFGAVTPYILPASLVLFFLLRVKVFIKFFRVTLPRLVKDEEARQALKASVLAGAKKSVSFRKKNSGGGLWTVLGALAVFFTLLIIRVYVQSDFAFGGVGDQPFHSLIVRGIMEQGSIVYTLQPYILRYSLPDLPLQYQQGLHVIVAYMASLFKWTPPEAVRLLDLLFQSLPVLGGFYLGRKCFNSGTYGLAFAFVFGFISRWPTFLPWGSNAFTLAFPLFLVTIASLSESWKDRIPLRDAVPLGLLIGFMGAIHPTFLFVIGLAVFIMFLLRRFSILHLLILLVIVFVFILPVVVTRAQDMFVSAQQAEATGGFELLGESWRYITTGDWLSPYLMLRRLIMFLVPASILWVSVRRNSKQSASLLKVAVVMLISGVIITFAMLFLVSVLPLPSLPQWQLHMGVIYNCLLIFAGILLGDVWSYIVNAAESSRAVLGKYQTYLVFILINFLIAFPFVYQGAIEFQKFMVQQLGYYDAMTQDDLALIRWMEDNIPEESNVLVNRFQGGVYLPSLAGYRTVLVPYASFYALTSDYFELAETITDGKFTRDRIEKLQQYGFEYVFVGGKQSPQAKDLKFDDWKPETLLNNPNYKPVKSFGGSYLFAIDLSNPDIIFKEDFMEGSLEHWELATKGQGPTTEIIENVGDGTRLQITAKKLETEDLSAVYLHRFIDVWTSDIGMGFKVDVSGNVSGSYQISVIDTSWSKRIDIPIEQSGEYIKNIGELWKAAHGTDIPQSFIVQLIVRDKTGAGSSATFDYVNIHSHEIIQH